MPVLNIVIYQYVDLFFPGLTGRLAGGYLPDRAKMRRHGAIFSM
ncbi:hypothetical protein A11S_1638 [Micavibrio aeruginosavorus EPB]|uniref:Uncharacterized protein n=1 Tax=Micavibrio aeruginosavorus EPB TaxID=349215 RepID=M4VGE3_9BACT|nr:hypothetical protein A11S_1638 [Micavibrio aeruginosavorus EPB]